MALVQHVDRLLPRGLSPAELFQARFVAIVGFIAVMTGLWTGVALFLLPLVTLSDTALKPLTLVPLAYRGATAARGFLDQRKADKLGVPLSQVGQFSGQGGQLSARIAGAEQSVREVAERNPADAETRQFVSAMNARLVDLSAAVTAAENMPSHQRRAAHTAIGDQLDGIDADLMARLGVF